MTPLEALSDMERLCSQLMASPPEIRCLVVFAVAEIDRQRLAASNPTQAAMIAAMPDQLMAGGQGHGLGSGRSESRP